MIQLYHPMAYRATPSPFPHPRIFLASHVSLPPPAASDRKSTRLNSSHLVISYAVFCLKKKTLSSSFSSSIPYSDIPRTAARTTWLAAASLPSTPSCAPHHLLPPAPTAVSLPAASNASS